MVLRQPKKINPLAEALKVNGYQVVTPVLKGHTGLRQDLIGVTHEDWLESAREGLKSYGKRVTR